MFGSVPLRTYLPDGDIDLTALYSGPPMNSWTDKLRDILHAEEKNPLAEFSVRDVQTIHAEVCSSSAAPSNTYFPRLRRKTQLLQVHNKRPFFNHPYSPVHMSYGVQGCLIAHFDAFAHE